MRVDGGKAVIPNVIKAVEIARQRGILVVWVVFCLFISFAFPFFFCMFLFLYLFLKKMYPSKVVILGKVDDIGFWVQSISLFLLSYKTAILIEQSNWIFKSRLADYTW